ncbi:MAG: DEAD/DEAH box helicase [Aridibacter sp.]
MQIEETKETTFAGFGLNDKLLKAIKELGYETPSPIQEKTIPLILEGRDIIGQAQTGTGKTAAFSLPMLEKIDPKSKQVQALVLTPTRELAIQVAEAIHSYAKHIGRIRILPVYGGQSISQQIRHLRSGVQIIVGTPGRVMDHLRRETVDISNLKVMVLDEADEMLRMGFIDDVEWILSHTPETRQTALFSATMPRQIRRIAEKHIQNAVHVEIEQKTLTVPAIKQFYINLPERQKTDALTKILEIQSIPGEAVLIFHRTKIGTAQLTDKLQARGYAAEAMNGDMNQNQRESVIKRMKNGKIEIVVATDVAARGLDVEHITTVVNYDMPSDTESYVHRIGRTGRAGREGKAVLFVTPRQQRMLRDIERYTKQKIEPLRLPTEADVAARREERVKKQLTDTLEEQDLSVYLKLVKELAEETTIDIADIAAAATFLSVGDKQLTVSTGNDTKQFSFSEEGMVRLFIGIGRKHRVSPGDIVGAIANEADIPGKVIGAIDVNDGFTLVDIPAEFVERVLTNMQFSQIRKQNMNIRLASTGEVQTTRDTPPRERNSGRIENKPRRKSKGNDDGKKKGKRKTLAKDSPFANFKKRKKTKKKK